MDLLTRREEHLVDTEHSAPLISIGLPVYNGADFLAGAIDSMLSQDIDDLELIISDNGSTDATKEICEDYQMQDSRVRYYRAGMNRGAAWNYNRTFDLARGTYFKWAAHDDLCAQSFLSRCITRLESNPDASLCYASTIRIDEAGCEVSRDGAVHVARERRPSSRVKSLLANPTPCFEVFGVTRRAQLALTGLIGNYTSSDRVLLLQLALLGRFVAIDDYLFYNRQHTQRSVRRYADPRQRNAWFDPSRKPRSTAPTWRLLREYATAISGAQQSVSERSLSLAPLAQWMGTNRARLLREGGRYVVTTVAVPRR